MFFAPSALQLRSKICKKTLPFRSKIKQKNCQHLDPIFDGSKETNVSLEKLKKLGKYLYEVPELPKLFKKTQKLLAYRKASLIPIAYGVKVKIKEKSVKVDAIIDSKIKFSLFKMT